MTYVGSTIRVVEPSEQLIQWCKAHLTLPNPDYYKKERMGLWVGNTPDTISLWRMGRTVPSHLPMLEMPFGVFLEVRPLLENVTIIFGKRDRVDYGEPIPLYDYQRQAVDEVVRRRYGILQAPAGCGKTQMGLAVIQQHGYKALWLTHTKDLLNQSKERAERYMNPELMGTITEGKVNIGSGITFATVQTMSKMDLREYRNEWGVIICDECFPGNTMITTADGYKRIDAIKQGDIVLARTESGKLIYRKVTHVFKKAPLSLMTLRLKNGLELNCTTNHPILTKRGYVKAGEIIGTDEVCCLRENVRSGDIVKEQIQVHSQWSNLTKLFRRLRRYRTQGKNPQIMDTRASRIVSTDISRNQQEICLGTDESQQSIKARRCTQQDFIIASGNESSATSKRREWSGNDGAATSFDKSAKRLRSSCRGRIYHSYTSTTVSGIPDTLQDRHCNSICDGGNRDRRRLTQQFESTSCGREENGLLEWVGVESIEIHQQECDGGYGRLCPSDYVYNLEVDCDHNYFANGINVHNCHRVCCSPTGVAMFEKVLNSLSCGHKYGLSATVHRADGLIRATFALIGKVVYTVPEDAVKALVEPVRVETVQTGAVMPEDAVKDDGSIVWAKLINGLCADRERNRLIVEKLRENQGYSCLILSDRLAHLEELMAELPADMRDDAVMISGRMTSKKGKAEREQAIEDMRTGKKKYLFSSYNLSKEGLDIPRLERLFLTTPQKDEAVIIQSIGRIARKFDGKAKPVCVDFVDGKIGVMVGMWKKRMRIYREKGVEM